MLSYGDIPTSKEEPTMIAVVRKSHKDSESALIGEHVFVANNPNESHARYESTYKKDLRENNDDENYVPVDFCKSLQLNKDAYFQLTPSVRDGYPNRIMLIASPGAGKSYFICQYALLYQHMYKDHEIFIISRKSMNEEQMFENLRFTQIDPETEEFFLKPLKTENFRNCLIIFDDVATYHPAVVQMINLFRDDVIKVGRSRNIEVLQSNHIMKDGRNTQSGYLLNTHLITFTKSQKAQGIDLLKDKLAIPTYVSKFLYKLKTRTLIFSLTSPQYVMTENNIYMLDELTEALDPKNK